VVIELDLSDPDGLGKVLVWQLRVDDLVAVPSKEGRFDAAWNGLPAPSD
jgi:hypothetical protein